MVKSSHSPVERQKEPQKLVIRGRCRSSATLGHGNMASDVAELRMQSPGYQYQSQWIHPDMSLEQPDTQKPAAHGRTHDGRRNYEHFVTAYDVHFIVNNKYYAMNIQEKSESI